MKNIITFVLSLSLCLSAFAQNSPFSITPDLNVQVSSLPTNGNYTIDVSGIDFGKATLSQVAKALSTPFAVCTVNGTALSLVIDTNNHPAIAKGTLERWQRMYGQHKSMQLKNISGKYSAEEMKAMRQEMMKNMRPVKAK